MADQSLINSARRMYQAKAQASQKLAPFVVSKVFGSFEKIIKDADLKFEQNIEKYGIDTGDITPQIAASIGDKGSEFIDNQFNDIQELSRPFTSKKKKAEILGRVNQRQVNLATIKKEQEIYDATRKKIIAKKGVMSAYNSAGIKASYADFSDPSSEWNKNIFSELEGTEERPVGIYTKIDGEDVNVNTLQEPVEVAIREQAKMAKVLKSVEDYKKNLKPGDTWEGSSFRNNIMAEINAIISTPEIAGSLAFDGFPGDRDKGMSFLTAMAKEYNVNFDNIEDIDLMYETLKSGDITSSYRSWAMRLADNVFANTQTRPTKPKGGSGKEEEEKDLSYIVGALNNKMDFQDPYDRNTKYVYDAKAGKYTTYYYGKPLQDPNFEKTLYIDSLNEFNTLIPGLNYMAKPVEEKENTPYSTSSAARGFNSNLNLPKK
tara:strand:+ start:504 stop:1799 length:1296 start_codon:yes stop_codon:yes gene_type:complete